MNDSTNGSRVPAQWVLFAAGTAGFVLGGWVVAVVVGATRPGSAHLVLLLALGIGGGAGLYRSMGASRVDELGSAQFWRGVAGHVRRDPRRHVVALLAGGAVGLAVETLSRLLA